VDVIITEMCVFEIDKEARELVLTEVCEGLTVEDIRAKTDADFKVADDLKTVAYA
jgi:3-oxoacid CoA-transferase